MAWVKRPRLATPASIAGSVPLKSTFVSGYTGTAYIDSAHRTAADRRRCWDAAIPISGRLCRRRLLEPEVSDEVGARVHLIQALLPLTDNDGRRFPGNAYAPVRTRLIDRFGGLTVYARAPAEGLWADGEPAEAATRDEIVIFEVMAETLDEAWWTGFRRELEADFRQEKIVIRTHPIRLL